MTNSSKTNDPRFWRKWASSGAIGNVGKATYTTRDGTKISVNDGEVSLEGKVYRGFPGVVVVGKPGQSGGYYQDKDDTVPEGLVVNNNQIFPPAYLARGDKIFGNGYYLLDEHDPAEILSKEPENVRFVGSVRGDDPSFESCSMYYVLADKGLDPRIRIGYNAVFAIPSNNVVNSAEGKPLKGLDGRNYQLVVVTDRIVSEE